MTILKEIMVNGVMKGAHQVRNGTLVLFPDGYEVNLRVYSWVDREAMDAGVPADTWMLPPIRDFAPASAPVIEQFLIDSEEKFAGGVLDTLDPLQNAFYIAQNKKLAEINAAWFAELDGGFDHAGYRWQSDPFSRNNITGMAVAIKSDYPLRPDFYWTTADNINIPMDNVAFLQLSFALADHISRLQPIARDLKDRALAATTIEELQAIAWPTEPQP